MIFALVGAGRDDVEYGAIVAMGIGAGFAAVAMAISFWRLGRR